MTNEAREEMRDPSAHRSRTRIPGLVADAVTDLARERYLLNVDVPRIVERALVNWDRRRCRRKPGVMELGKLGFEPVDAGH